MIAAVVPVKSLDASKSRLLPRLGSEGARRLALAMLEDVIEALHAVPEIDVVAVTTPDIEVAATVDETGAQLLLRHDPGLNPSVEAAGVELLPNPDDALLVVLGDVAGVQADDLRRLIRALPKRGVALAPAQDGGTAALLRRPRDVIPANFGSNSAKRHRELCEQAGVTLREIPLRSLALDLDTPEDIDAFLETALGGRRTRRLLHELEQHE
ncbi:MAG: 2-phospho-L-lactate guanylyltransferase [Deltaproteobacteria bacterium]|nr:2-phospho-L-lactate guanylyltransferase [Deltaproteobacteria bacterium]MBW2361379.1 2-phospho-L-lactate guanylyltransferase [Deltaproteobacteria bacterium]